MPLHRKIILVASQVTVLALLFFPQVAGAQTVSNARAVTLQATLEQTGKLSITQDIALGASRQLRWIVYGRVAGLTVQADEQVVPDDQLTLRQGDGELVIQSEKSATTWRLSYTASSQLIRSTERDQLFLPILKETGGTIEELKIIFRLPDSASGSGLIGNLYAIGGVTEASVTTLDQQSLEGSARRIGPKATVTLSAHWPKSVLRLSPVQELRLALANLEILPWLVIGFLLPIISFLVLARLIIKQRRQESSKSQAQTTPPEPLSPLIVGTLVDKKVYPREIVAMLIDLCRRGYVVIVKKSGQYYLSQRKPLDTSLEPWEQDILEALFPIANTKVTTQAMSRLNRQSLFSPKVRRAFKAMYDVITTKQYFAENPHQTRVRYKLFALALYFLSVVGAIWIAVTGSSPYLLLPAAGTMLVCRLIMAYTPGLVHYTPAGRLARGQWLAFGEYLSRNQALPLEDSRNQAFEKYLGYAVALDVTLLWARRFDLSKIVIVKPDWFVSYEETTTAQFAIEIEEFSQSISKLVTEMRGPIVS